MEPENDKQSRKKSMTMMDAETGGKELKVKLLLLLRELILQKHQVIIN